MHVHAPRSDEEVVTLPSHVVSCHYYHSYFHHDFLSGTQLPPIWPEFEFLTQDLIIWADFVGSLLCSYMFFPGYSGVPFSRKTNINFYLICCDPVGFVASIHKATVLG